MDKRTIKIRGLIAVIFLVLVALGLSSCDKVEEGIYYGLETLEQMNPENWVRIKDGQWSAANGYQGRYSFSDGELRLYTVIDGEIGMREEFFIGQYEDGALRIRSKKSEALYCLPSAFQKVVKREKIRIEQEGKKLLYEMVDGGYAVVGMSVVLEDVVIPASYNGLPVIKIGKGAFSSENGAYIRSVSIPQTVQEIGKKAFFNCDNLVSVSLPEGLLSIDAQAFSGCGKLTEIIIPSSVRAIEDEAFLACESLESIELKNGLELIGVNAFQGCKSLTAITIPESVLSVRDGAFYGCTQLSSVKLPTGGILLGKEVFAYCDNLKRSEKVGVWYIGDVEKPYMLAISSEKSITGAMLPDTVTSVARAAFANCEDLRNISIPSSVEVIGAYAFLNCTVLQKIHIPQSVHRIGEMAFSGCNRLIEVTYDGTVDQARSLFWQAGLGGTVSVRCVDGEFRFE